MAMSIDDRNNLTLTSDSGTTIDLHPVLAVGPASTVPGPPGSPGNYINRFRAAWSASTAYLAGDIVTRAGSSWLAIADSTNVTPVEGASWTAVALGGTGQVNTVNLLAPDGTGNVDLPLDLKADLVSGLVPASQLPSYVDDVLSYANLAAFPSVGESGKIYIAEDTNLTYRWGGSTYGVLDPSLALGETSQTAYRGDRGKTAYDHSQTTGNPHGTTATDVGAASAVLGGAETRTTATGSGTKTLDASTASGLVLTALTGAVTIAVTNMSTTKMTTLTVAVAQGATVQTVTWPTVNWAANTAPVMTANKTTIVTLWSYDGATLYGSSAVFG